VLRTFSFLWNHLNRWILHHYQALKGCEKSCDCSCHATAYTWCC